MRKDIRQPPKGAVGIGRNLHLPRDKFERQTRTALDYFKHAMDAPGDLVLYHINKNHIEVPRHYLDHGLLKKHGFILHSLVPPVSGVARYDNLIQLRDGQLPPAAAIKGQEGVLNLGCGKGKTVLGLNEGATRRTPMVVVVNTTVLLRQWEERAIEFLPSASVGVVQGKRAEWDKDIVICMLHSLANKAEDLPESIIRRFGLSIYDEAHHMSATQFSKAANLFYCDRLALTATPKRIDGLSPVYEWHLGPRLYEDTSYDINPKVYFQETGVRLTKEQWADSKDINGEFNTSKLYGVLSRIEERNDLILSDLRAAVDAGRCVMIVSHLVDHLKTLHAAFGSGALILGEVKQDVRWEALKKERVIFGITQLAQENLDKPELDTVLFTTPYSSPNAIQQGLGRIARIHPGKKAPFAIYYLDSAIKPAKSMTRKLQTWLKKHQYKQILLPKRGTNEPRQPKPSGTRPIERSTIAAPRRRIPIRGRRKVHK